MMNAKALKRMAYEAKHPKIIKWAEYNGKRIEFEEPVSVQVAATLATMK